MLRLRPWRIPPASAAAWWARRAPTHEGAFPNRDADDIVVPASRAAFGRARDALLRYDVYAPDLLVHRVCAPDGRVAPGALIVQRVRLAPLVAVEAGVRVLDAWDEPDRAGFRYGTLRGHPERGVAGFSLSFDEAAGRATFRIESDSGPALWASRLRAGQARRLQRRAVAGALERMRSRLEN